MTTKTRGLGRGLDALLGDRGSKVEPSQRALKTLPIEFLQRGKYQPRQDMNAEKLQELADSIREQGIIQPIIVRELGDQRYEIIAGERRWRATQKAGIQEIPAIIHEIESQQDLMELSLIENIQRENLSPIEEATGLKRLLDEFGLTHQQVAEAVGRSRVAVSNLLRLLKLDPGVREHLDAGHIEAGHARAILGLPREQQGLAAQAVMQRRLSVRQAEQLVRRMLQPEGADQNKARKPAKGGDIQRLEEELSEHLAAPVHLESRDGKSGRLVIGYSSLDELDGILSRIRK